MATSTPPAKTPNAPKSRKLLVLLIVLATLIVLAVAGAAYYLTIQRKQAAPVAAAPADPIFIALEPMTVNLQPNGRNRFLHVAVTLKAPDVKSQALVTQYLPEVRSRLLSALSNRAGESLVTPEERAQLAADIMTTLNQPFAANLPSLKISSVMFTTFMLQ
ncbi:flagellar basal body-associated protein FliL [Polaromonas sp.]|uniref:flagellar basal body-associated protein FliL n=1 Tax=Polaromonas sp. TaxID=1869339 RepID=UPI002487A5F3|nr:flagellar basal body-associated protein FliL [Polaromonas sp.]MDI1338837.1 flagellar basal body-associated protein FliL [Polaromonas sp.]